MATFSQDPVFGANAKKGSNAYASGANQNCGNVITDRPTTRLHAPPGGSSSICLSDGSSEIVAPRSCQCAGGSSCVPSWSVGKPSALAALKAEQEEQAGQTTPDH